MPTLMAGRWVYCIVPGPTKTEAVTRTLRDPITTACPATIMRRHPQAVLYLDSDAAAGV
jgi:glucosamine-6-phosphate deaminase